jgi:hypothetical protein
MIALPAQELIAEFGIDEFGMPLFVPDSALYRESMGTGEAESDQVKRVRLEESVRKSPSRSAVWLRMNKTGRKTKFVRFRNNDGRRRTNSRKALQTPTPVSRSIYLLSLAGVQDGATAVTFLTKRRRHH